MKISRYLKLLKIARYAPVIALTVSAILSSEIGVTGERIPKGEDPSIF